MQLAKTQNNCYIDLETGNIVYYVKEIPVEGRSPMYAVYAHDKQISIEFNHKGAAVNYLKDFMRQNYRIFDDEKPESTPKPSKGEYNASSS